MAMYIGLFGMGKKMNGKLPAAVIIISIFTLSCTGDMPDMPEMPEHWGAGTPPSNPDHGDEWTAYMGSDHVPIIMVWVESGSFMMGAQDGEQNSYDNEYPRHQVTISRGFWMGKCEVTQAQWQAVTGSNPSSFAGSLDLRLPIEEVSWDDIHNDFLSEINVTETGDPWRLPSEAEWEYACRAGTTTRFPWGDDLDYSQLGDYAWCFLNSPLRTHDVGQKLPNGWGLYDMHGNVWELCEDDWHYSYEGAPSDGSAWVDTPRGTYRVLRGGSRDNELWNCRSARRSGREPAYHDHSCGFRLVRASSGS